MLPFSNIKVIGSYSILGKGFIVVVGLFLY